MDAVTRAHAVAAQGMTTQNRNAPRTKEGATYSEIPLGEGPASDEDLTARVRIREAALKHFADEGYERSTIRAIARTAGVSHGMLRHHFGSKVDLRAACDAYVCKVLHRLNTLMVDTPNVGKRSLRRSKSLWRYAARSLADGSPTAGPIFDEMVTMTARHFVRVDATSDQTAETTRLQAGLLAAMTCAIPLFHDHLSRVIDLDTLTPEGDRLVTLALLDLFALSDDAPSVASVQKRA